MIISTQPNYSKYNSRPYTTKPQATPFKNNISSATTSMISFTSDELSEDFVLNRFKNTVQQQISKENIDLDVFEPYADIKDLKIKEGYCKIIKEIAVKIKNPKNVDAEELDNLRLIFDKFKNANIADKKYANQVLDTAAEIGTPGDTDILKLADENLKIYQNKKNSLRALETVSLRKNESLSYIKKILGNPNDASIHKDALKALASVGEGKDATNCLLSYIKVKPLFYENLRYQALECLHVIDSNTFHNLTEDLTSRLSKKNTSNRLLTKGPRDHVIQAENMLSHISEENPVGYIIKKHLNSKNQGWALAKVLYTTAVLDVMKQEPINELISTLKKSVK